MKLYTIKHPDGTILFDTVSPSIFDPWAMLLRARNGLDEEWMRARGQGSRPSFVSFARDSGYKLVRVEIVEREEEPDPKDWSQRGPE